MQFVRNYSHLKAKQARIYATLKLPSMARLAGFMVSQHNALIVRRIN